MKKSVKILLILIFQFALGCSKPNPNPELKDQIYMDLIAEYSATKSLIDSSDKDAIGIEKELKEAQPQTGLKRALDEKLNGSRKTALALKQHLDYLAIKIDSLKKQNRESYNRAFQQGSGDQWVPAGDYEDYQRLKKLRMAKKVWDVNSRIEKLNSDAKEVPQKSGGH